MKATSVENSEHHLITATPTFALHGSGLGHLGIIQWCYEQMPFFYNTLATAITSWHIIHFQSQLIVLTIRYSSLHNSHDSVWSYFKLVSICEQVNVNSDLTNLYFINLSQKIYLFMEWFMQKMWFEYMKCILNYITHLPIR